MNLIQKVVNYIRIAPHGFIPVIGATGLTLGMALNLGFFNNLSQESETLNVALATFIFAFNGKLAFNGIGNYKKFSNFIKRYGINKKHIEPNLKHYCERQAYKAAAYSYSLGEEFNTINRNYTGKKYFKWLPEI